MIKKTGIVFGIVLFISIVLLQMCLCIPGRDEILYEVCSMDQEIQQLNVDSLDNVPPLLLFFLRFFNEIGLNTRIAGCFFLAINGVVYILCIYYSTLLVSSDTFYSKIAFFIALTHYYTVIVFSKVLRDGPYLALTALCFTLILIGIKQENLKRKFLSWIIACVLSSGCAMYRREGVEVFAISYVWICIESIHSFIEKKRIIPYAMMLPGLICIYALSLFAASVVFKRVGWEWNIFDSIMIRI